MMPEETDKMVKKAAAELEKALKNRGLGDLIRIKLLDAVTTVTGGSSIQVATLRRKRTHVTVEVWCDKWLDEGNFSFWVGFGADTRAAINGLITDASQRDVRNITGHSAEGVDGMWTLRIAPSGDAIDHPVKEFYDDNGNGYGIYFQPGQGIDIDRAVEFIASVILALPEFSAQADAENSLRKAFRGQGFGLTAEQRKAVEELAMTMAEKWLEEKNYTGIKRVSESESCDFRAEINGQPIVVEVKGTTGPLGSICLTRNEVKLHKKSHPNNVLLVLHGVKLSGETTRASGGTLVPFENWLLDETRLRPISYEYLLPTRD
jgi:hypothetical protein